MEIVQFNGANITKVTALPNEFENNSFYWLDASTHEIQQVLNLLENAGLHLYERHINDISNPQHPCSYESVQDYYLLIFRTLPALPAICISESKQISFIVTPHLVVTISDADSLVAKSIEALTPISTKVKITPEFLVYYLLNLVVDQFVLLKAPLNQTYDHWESILLQATKPPSGWADFLDFRSIVRQLSMLSEEQEDAVTAWCNDLTIKMTEYMQVRIRDLLGHIRRIQKHTQRLESDIESLVELHYFVLEHRTNEIVRVLTVISCIFMPLTLITGIFGMNFKFMSILDWPLGFALTLFSMVIVTVILLAIFRLRNWI